MYKLLREPTSLDEFDWKKLRRIAIWRENGTVIIICQNWVDSFWERHLCLVLENVCEKNFHCTIYGETDAAIAETFAFFGSLQHASEKQTEIACYSKKKNELEFDFTNSLQPTQLAQVLDSNPTRRVCINAKLSPEQAVILASRPYPLDLRLMGHGVAFLDDGKAFVDALENRVSTFGSLDLFQSRNRMCLSSANLRRLSNLEKLKIVSYNRECALTPLSAKVNVLNYRLFSCHIEPEDFISCEIRARDLTLHLWQFSDEHIATLTAFLNQVTTCGHIERLCLSIESTEPFDFDDVAPVARALIRVIYANPNLQCLDLSKTESRFYWGPHFQGVFEAIEGHPSLRTLVVQSFATKFDSLEGYLDKAEGEFVQRYYFNRSTLQHLLSRNRNVVVQDKSGKKCTDGSTIDELYALNKFYNGSAGLVAEATVVRPPLVATTLAEGASKSFQRTALLLANHTDTLCEFIHTLNLDCTFSPTSLSRESSQCNRIRKRKKSGDAAIFARKTTRNEN
jgi:hypothetical protein